MTSQKRSTSKMVAVIAGGVLAATALAACGSSSSDSGTKKDGFSQAKQDSKSTITVWVDQTRAAAATAFEKANPDTKIKVVTYDGSANGSNSFKTKMSLFDRAGNGWPDVVFSSQNNDAAWASQGTNGTQAFAAPLNKGLVPNDTLAGFAKGALNPCTVSGTVYCLRNDLAQNVTWYDAKLMKQFGYTVPTTWEQYQALGERVAMEHPGYILGAVGDGFGSEIYMWASKCQANDVTGARSMTIKTDSTECKRAASMIDAMVANKTMTTLSVFTPQFLQKYTGKVLMMPGPAWYSGAIFNSKSALNVPAGELGVAAPLAWGSDAPVTGNVGGGTWFLSSHSKNLAAAVKFATWVTTADAYQVDLAPGFPAYTAAATKWLAKQKASGYYATDLQPITSAATEIWSGWGSPAFSQEAIFAKTIIPGLTSGKKFVDMLPDWQTAIVNQAKVNGYKVSS